MVLPKTGAFLKIKALIPADQKPKTVGFRVFGKTGYELFYWGEGLERNARSMGALPDGGEWVELTVPWVWFPGAAAFELSRIEHIQHSGAQVWWANVRIVYPDGTERLVWDNAVPKDWQFDGDWFEGAIGEGDMLYGSGALPYRAKTHNPSNWNFMNVHMNPHLSGVQPPSEGAAEAGEEAKGE
jgi:hypothetical protein